MINFHGILLMCLLAVFIEHVCSQLSRKSVMSAGQQVGQHATLQLHVAWVV